MPDGFELALIAGMIIVVAGLGFALICLADRERPTDAEPHSASAPPDQQHQVTLAGVEDVFIPMPDHLKTPDEIVAWLVSKMPKLTAEFIKGPPGGQPWRTFR